MEEKIKVKLILRQKQVLEKEYMNYDNALDFVKKKTNEGYTCLVLRQVENKNWVKIWFYPPESL